MGSGTKLLKMLDHAVRQQFVEALFFGVGKTGDVKLLQLGQVLDFLGQGRDGTSAYVKVKQFGEFTNFFRQLRESVGIHYEDAEVLALPDFRPDEGEFVCAQGYFVKGGHFAEYGRERVELVAEEVDGNDVGELGHLVGQGAEPLACHINAEHFIYSSTSLYRAKKCERMIFCIFAVQIFGCTTLLSI